MLLNENIVNYKVVPNVLELRTSFLIVCIYMPLLKHTKCRYILHNIYVLETIPIPILN